MAPPQAPRKYPAVPEWENPPGPWPFETQSISVVEGSNRLMMRIDTEWSAYPDDDPTSAAWHGWHEAGKTRSERFVLVDETNMPLAAWLDRSELLQLAEGLAYRVDFAMVRPDLRRKGLGHLLVEAVKARAKVLGASRVVFTATPTSYFFWRVRMGAVHCKDWRLKCSDPRLKLQLAV